MPGDVTLVRAAKNGFELCFILLVCLSSSSSKHVFLMKDIWEHIQDILEYLGQFSDTEQNSGGGQAMHPLSWVMEAFKTKEIATATCDKLQQFLKDAGAACGRSIEFASTPVSCTNKRLFVRMIWFSMSCKFWCTVNVYDTRGSQLFGLWQQFTPHCLPPAECHSFGCTTWRLPMHRRFCDDDSVIHIFRLPLASWAAGCCPRKLRWLHNIHFEEGIHTAEARLIIAETFSHLLHLLLGEATILFVCMYVWGRLLCSSYLFAATSIHMRARTFKSQKSQIKVESLSSTCCFYCSVLLTRFEGTACTVDECYLWHVQFTLQHHFKTRSRGGFHGGNTALNTGCRAAEKRCVSTRCMTCSFFGGCHGW